jgi:threonine dehydrogenase-like Zn-dependent dehydrogenase
MKALVYTGPRGLVLRDEPEPSPGEGEVLVRVEAVGICGSDMHAYHGHDERRPAPLILGHEAAGTLLGGRRAGERVAINPLVSCGRCRFCLDGRGNLCRGRQVLSLPPRAGAFAERVIVPEANLVAVPEGLGVVQAALAEPMAVAWHAVRIGARALARPLAASPCVVLGGGAIGLAAALVLGHFGARGVAVAETNALRRKTAAAAGPFFPFAPGGAGEPEAGTVDLVIDAVGAEATRAAACRLAAPGGVIVHIGLLPGAGGLDVRRMTLQEITVLGSYCYTKVDFAETVAALGAGCFGPLGWIEERALKEGPRAFADLDGGRVAAAKIVLRPG